MTTGINLRRFVSVCNVGQRDQRKSVIGGVAFSKPQGNDNEQTTAYRHSTFSQPAYGWSRHG